MATSGPAIVGQPRFDKTIRLLHRFYEPLVLLRILEPTRLGHTVLSKSDNLTRRRRECLDHLSSVVDYEPGGETVAAIAMEATPTGVKYWLSTNERSMNKSSSHLAWILCELGPAHSFSAEQLAALELKITKHCITFSRKKLRNYNRRMNVFLKRVQELLSTSDVQLHQDLLLLNQDLQDDEELCNVAYSFRDKGTMALLDEKHADAISPTPWSFLRHYIGRIGSWKRASKALVALAKSSPILFNDFCIDHVILPPPIDAPKPDSKTTLHSALGRMIPADEPEQLQLVRDTLLGSRVVDFSTRFSQEYTNPNFRPHIHAELMLVEHFYHRKLDFVENDRYIGCSKPSCYCCDLYIKHHPGHLVPRPCHGNVWKSWRAPIVPNPDKNQATKFTANMLNNMNKSIRQDIMFQIASRYPRRTRLPDSDTGISNSQATVLSQIGPDHSWFQD